METWLLILVMSFHEGYAGGLTSQTMTFNSKSACESTAFSIRREMKNSGKMTMDTTGRYVTMRPQDPNRHWFAANVKSQTYCVKVVK